MATNPYQSPTVAVLGLAPANAQTVALREAHLRHEVQIQALGSLCLLAALVLGFVAVETALLGLRSAGANLWMRMMMLGFAVASAASFLIGIGFRRLQPWVRIPGGIVAVLALPKFPAGTLLGAWVLYLILSEPGRVVLSPAYQEVIAATAHIRAGRSRVGRYVLWLLLVLIAVFVAGVLIPQWSSIP